MPTLFCAHRVKATVAPLTKLETVAASPAVVKVALL